MRIIGILGKHNNYYYISCYERKFLISSSNISETLLESSLNLIASATVDFERSCDLEEFAEFWLKEDLEIIHPLLKHYELQKFDN
jgi:hypothetical protein